MALFLLLASFFCGFGFALIAFARSLAFCFVWAGGSRLLLTSAGLAFFTRCFLGLAHRALAVLAVALFTTRLFP